MLKRLLEVLFGSSWCLSSDGFQEKFLESRFSEMETLLVPLFLQ